MAVGLRNPLKPKTLVKTPASNPTYSILALMLFWKTRDNEGKPIGFINSIREGYAIGKKKGQEAAQKGIDALKRLFEKEQSEADIAMGKRAAAWDQHAKRKTDPAEGSVGEILPPEDRRSSVRDVVVPRGPDVIDGEIMPDGTPPGPGRRGVGSDYVGPERQVTRNDDPWPLAAPTGRRSSAGRALPAPDRDAANDNEMSPGEAAAMRGAERARKMIAEGKISPARKPGTSLGRIDPKGEDLEM